MSVHGTDTKCKMHVPYVKVHVPYEKDEVITQT